MSGRPRDFWLNGGHPLAQGLVFAGLGRIANSTHYRDSSPYGNHGSLAGSAAAWSWNNQTLRNCVTLGAGLNYVTVPSGYNRIAGTATWTIALTVKISALDSGGTILWDAPSLDSLAMFIQKYSSGLFWGVGASYRTYSTASLPLNKVCQVTATKTAAGNNGELYIDGIRLASYTGTIGDTSATLSDLCYGSYRVIGYSVIGTIEDCCLWNRSLSVGEIVALADPSNVLLSGLILPPRRRLFATTTGNRRRRLLIAGAA